MATRRLNCETIRRLIDAAATIDDADIIRSSPSCRVNYLEIEFSEILRLHILTIVSSCGQTW